MAAVVICGKYTPTLTNGKTKLQTALHGVGFPPYGMILTCPSANARPLIRPWK